VIGVSAAPERVAAASAHAAPPEAELAALAVAVVVPAFRVAGKVGQVVRGLPPYVRHVIVVDDASPDEAAAEVRPLCSQRVRLVRHARNQGVGGAMLTGYAVALALGAEVVVKMDGDDQMDPAFLPTLLLPIARGEADYTKGNRFLHAYALGSMPFARRVGNFGLTFLTKLATGYWNIFDPNNGYTAIHARVLRLLDTDRIARRYFFETSMLLELRRVQAVVADAPIPARYGDEVSSLSLRRVLLDFPPQLLRGLLRRLGYQYFLHDFTAGSLLLLLSAPLLLFGALWGAAQWYRSFATGVPATTGTVLLAVLPIILGVQFLAQALTLDIGSVPQRSLHPRLPPPESEARVTHRAPLSTYLDRNAETLMD
jgi:dolichol-phosphate mannosyltransferase